MKKLFAVLLALGLIVAFSATASAANVKFSGSYYLVGVYDDNPSLKENDGYSRAYMFQRIRIMPVIEIAKGLTFTARMDAMEGIFDLSNTRSARTPATNRNFDWERGWVTFTTGMGKFDVGYMSGGAWGTKWADSEGVRARVKYTGKFGPVLLIAIFEKNYEGEAARTYDTADNADKMKVDTDVTAYYLAPIYNFKGGSAGILYGYVAINNTRPYNPLTFDPANKKFNGYKTIKQILYPYFKGTFGPVYVEAEVNYIFGTKMKWEDDAKKGLAAGYGDVDFDGWGAYVMAKTAMGPATIGAQLGWSAGDDPGTKDKDETGPGKGADWNPALILFNDDLNSWSGGDMNTNGSVGANTNCAYGYLIFNVFADYKVTPKFSMGAALTYAKADEVPDGADDEYGTEFDITATYKIYDNLSYMVGAGFLWTGDAFKSKMGEADNDYILMNKLTLTF